MNFVRHLFLTIFLLQLCATRAEEFLPPFELAGFKLGSYSTEYDKKWVAAQRRIKLDIPFICFTEYELTSANDRLRKIKLFAPPARIRTRSGATAEQIDAAYNHYFERLTKEIQSQLKTCKWDKTGHSFTANEETVKGQLFFGRGNKEYQLTASIVHDDYFYLTKPFAQPNTIAITNIFGVGLGTNIKDVALPIIKRKKNVSQWQYAFQPTKITSGANYRISVKEDKVVAIQALFSSKKNKYCNISIDQTVNEFRSKYGIAFSWEDFKTDYNDAKYALGFLDCTKSSARHVGYKNDYTILEIIHFSHGIPPYKKESMTITLYRDEKREHHDILCAKPTD